LHIGSNLPPKDNLRKEDKSSAPKVSFIRRFHCTSLCILFFKYYVAANYSCCREWRMLTNDALTNMHILPYLNAETLKGVRPCLENTLGACPWVLFSKNVVYQKHMQRYLCCSGLTMNAWMLSCALGYLLTMHDVIMCSWVHARMYVDLLYEAMQEESAELCFIFCSARRVLYFPLENIVPEILLRIRCNKPVKVLLMLVHYGKYCTWAWSRGKYSIRLRLVLY